MQQKKIILKLRRKNLENFFWENPDVYSKFFTPGDTEHIECTIFSHSKKNFSASAHSPGGSSAPTPSLNLDLISNQKKMG